ncbi:MAG: alpha/beta fold hydrolase [Pirellulales bacterium]
MFKLLAAPWAALVVALFVAQIGCVPAADSLARTAEEAAGRKAGDKQKAAETRQTGQRRKQAQSGQAEQIPPAAKRTKKPAKTEEPAVKKPAVKKELPAPKYLAGVPLIGREALFGNPNRAAARLSPDGARLSYLAPVNGVLNVWVGPVDKPSAARPVTKDEKRGIRIYFWAFTNEHIIYLQDAGGDEDWHVYCVDLASGETKDLTPLEKVNAQIEVVSHRVPGEIMVALNNRDPEVHDLYRVDLATGKRSLVEENTERFMGYVVDEDFKVRFASRFTDDGGNEILQSDGKGGWSDFVKIPIEDTLTTSPAGFNKKGDVLYLIDSRGRDTGALTAWDLNSGRQQVLAENDKADIGGVLAHPTENTIEAVSFTYARKEWQVLDPAVAADLEFLKSQADGEVEVTSRTLDDKLWTVAYLLDDGPVKYYLYDRRAKKATFLFNNRDDLEGLPLVKMHPVVIRSRDGLDLVSYLTLPPGTDSDGDARPDAPLPLVLNVHGGPWARDAWGYDPEHQMLANRGYAVLAVNYRGSTGFGKNFGNAGNLEWAGKMHDDLVDAVEWAVAEKIADPGRVAIMGGSYGGYATLVGLTFTPEVFACGVDIVGPSNILTLLSSIPPYWQPVVQMFKDRVGDYTSEEGKEFLTSRSPLTHVERIQRPLLIGQGANDPRVKQQESDQIVRAMQDKEIPVTYVLYSDEGHGFARPENRMSFYAVAEAFLAQHLGGRYEPVGDAFHGSTIAVPAGAEQVPGLAEAIDEASSSPSEEAVLPGAE